MGKYWYSRVGRPLVFAALAAMASAWAVTPALADPGSGSASWTSSGQSILNWRSQPAETSLSPANVGGLKRMFAIQTDGDVSATPNVSGGVAYFPDWGGSLWAVNATTGAKIWKVKLADYTGIAGTVSRTTPTSVGNGALLVGTQKGAYLLAISPRNGSLLWKVQLDTHPAAIVTQSPSVYQGVAYLGVASLEEGLAANPSYPCCSFRGSAVAVNLNSHKVQWKTYMAPDNEGYSGNSVWGSSPVVDPARHLVYLATGNNYTAPSCVQDGSCAPDPADLTDAVVALDMTTGAIVWADPFMGLGTDTWTVACFFGGPNCPSNAGPDYDFAQGPMKLKAAIGGQSVDMLAIGQKSGSFWGIDAATGKVLWHQDGGPGSALGGMEWGSATDGSRIYYAISNMYGSQYTLKDGSTTTGGLWGALDPATGAILWQTADPNGAMDPGAVSVANGVVYAGSMGNTVVGGLKGTAASRPTFFALDAATGQILWNYASGGSVNAGAAIANGVVYWGSGYGNLGLGDPNLTQNVFYGFSVQ